MTVRYTKNILIIVLVAIVQMQVCATTATTPPVPVVAPTAAVVTTPAAPAPTNDIAKVLASATDASLPLAGAPGPTKVSNFKIFFSIMNSGTAKDIVEKGAQAFQQLVLDVAIKSPTLTLENLDEINTVAGFAVSALRLSGDQNAARFNDAITKITARLTRQRAFVVNLDLARKMPDSGFDAKLKKYEAILGSIASDALESCKKILITDLGNCFLVAQKLGAAKIDAVKKLLVKTATLAGFSDQERQQFISIVSGAMVLPVAAINVPVVASTVGLNATIEAKIKELNQSTTVKQRCSVVHELISLINASSSLADKNQIITQANQLFMMQYNMNGIELAAVVDCLKSIIANTFMLLPEQRTIIDQWMKILSAAQGCAVADQVLLDTIKKALGNIKADTNRAVKAASFAITLLGTKLPPEELDKTKNVGLFSMLMRSMSVFYSLRSMRDLQLLANIQNIITVAAQNVLLKASINPAWVENITFLSKLGSIQQEANLFKRLQAYRLLIKDLKTTTDSFEKGAFINALVTLFANRYERAQLELDEFLRLLDDCLVPAVAAFFTAKEQKMFADWKKPLVMLVSLLNAQQQDSIKVECSLLKGCLPALAGNGVVKERAMFVLLLNGIVVHRGNLTAADMAEVISLLQDTKKPQQVLVGAQTKEQKVLSVSQEHTVDEWLTRLTAAQALTPAGFMYADALLKVARENADLAMYGRLLDIFVDASVATLARVNGYIDGLNKIIQSKEKIDMKAFKGLLNRVMQKKIGASHLLSDEQRRVVGLWEKSF